MTDVVADPYEPAQLHAFLEDYRGVYTAYVQEARALAAGQAPTDRRDASKPL